MLRQRIVGHLREAGSDSISGIARAMSEGRSRPIHRLTIAGYLQALSELGVLRELDRPPSKHYQLAEPDAGEGLHERVGRSVRETEWPEARQTQVATAVLEHLLRRPVFLAELRHAGLRPVLEDLVAVEADEERRRQIRALLRSRPLPRIDVPRGDPLVTIPDLPRVREAVPLMVRRVVLEATQAEHLALEPDRPAHQQLPLPMEDMP